jgi:hypothetical protein
MSVSRTIHLGFGNGSLCPGDWPPGPVANDIDACTETLCKETFKHPVLRETKHGRVLCHRAKFQLLSISNNIPSVCCCEPVKMLNWAYFFGTLLLGKGSAELNYYPLFINFINYCPQRFSLTFTNSLQSILCSIDIARCRLDYFKGSKESWSERLKSRVCNCIGWMCWVVFGGLSFTLESRRTGCAKPSFQVTTVAIFWSSAQKGCRRIVCVIASGF